MGKIFPPRLRCDTRVIATKDQGGVPFTVPLVDCDRILGVHSSKPSLGSLIFSPEHQGGVAHGGRHLLVCADSVIPSVIERNGRCAHALLLQPRHHARLVPLFQAQVVLDFLHVLTAIRAGHQHAPIGRVG